MASSSMFLERATSLRHCFNTAKEAFSSGESGLSMDDMQKYAQKRTSPKMQVHEMHFHVFLDW